MAVTTPTHNLLRKSIQRRLESSGEPCIGVLQEMLQQVSATLTTLEARILGVEQLEQLEQFLEVSRKTEVCDAKAEPYDVVRVI